MNTKLLTVLLSLLCSNMVLAAQQKRIITIDEIAEEVGLMFVGGKIPPSQRGIGELIPAQMVRSATGNLTEVELAILLANTLLKSGKYVFSKNRLRRILSPDGQAISSQAQQELDAKIAMLGTQQLPDGFAQAGITLPVLVERILDAAHSMLGMLDQRLVPALRAYLADLLLGTQDKPSQKNVRFATAVETN